MERNIGKCFVINCVVNILVYDNMGLYFLQENTVCVLLRVILCTC